MRSFAALTMTRRNYFESSAGRSKDVEIIEYHR